MSSDTTRKKGPGPMQHQLSALLHPAPDEHTLASCLYPIASTLLHLDARVGRQAGNMQTSLDWGLEKMGVPLQSFSAG